MWACQSNSVGSTLSMAIDRAYLAGDKNCSTHHSRASPVLAAHMAVWPKHWLAALCVTMPTPVATAVPMVPYGSMSGARWYVTQFMAICNAEFAWHSALPGLSTSCLCAHPVWRVCDGGGLARSTSCLIFNTHCALHHAVWLQVLTPAG